jgi:hypothetical protein
MVGRKRGFTLIELLGFLLMLFGAIVGISLGARDGVLTCVGLGLLGAVLGLLSPLLLLIPLSLLDRREFGPPRCFKGACGPTQYTWDLQAVGRRCRCRCGDEYELIDDRFVRHFDEGLQLPYMKRDCRGRWQPEVRVRQGLSSDCAGSATTPST